MSRKLWLTARVAVKIIKGSRAGIEGPSVAQRQKEKWLPRWLPKRGPRSAAVALAVQPATRAARAAMLNEAQDATLLYSIALCRYCHLHSKWADYPNNHCASPDTAPIATGKE